MKTRISRRTVLRGLVGGAAAAVCLPPLEAMLNANGTAYADGSPLPKRFGVFFWGNGYGWNQRGRPDRWTPTVAGSSWTPSEQLAPLGMGADGRSFVPKVSVVTGLEPHTSIPDSPGGQGDGHMRGVAVALSSDRPRSAGFYHPDHIFALNRATLDQVIAKHPDFYGSTPARFRSLELSVSGNRFHDYGTWTCISYNGEESQNLPLRSVDALYEQLFSVRMDNTERTSLLDAVAADTARLRARLGMRDQMRLDAHLDHVSEIQRRLRSSAAACTMPARPARAGGFDGSPGDEPLGDKLEAMARLLALALQCDLTRVFTVMFTGPGSQTVFRSVGANTGLHQLCHEDNWEMARRATIYTMESFRRFLAVLDDTPDAMGSVLDNSVILGTSEFSAGDVHDVSNFPVLLAGGGGGALRPGSYIHMPGANLSRIHLTALRALGLPYDSYGFNGGETREPIGAFLT